VKSCCKSKCSGWNLCCWLRVEVKCWLYFAEILDRWSNDTCAAYSRSLKSSLARKDGLCTMCWMFTALFVVERWDRTSLAVYCFSLLHGCTYRRLHRICIIIYIIYLYIYIWLTVKMVEDHCSIAEALLSEMCMKRRKTIWPPKKSDITNNCKGCWREHNGAYIYIDR